MISTDVDWERGAWVALLLLDPREWIFRRVESIQFLDELTIRRRVSVDFDADELMASAAPPGQPVPLALLEREGLVGFDLRDEASNAVPLLTAEQGGRLTLSALAALAESILGHRPSKGILRDLAQLVSAADQAEGVNALAAFERQAGHSRDHQSLVNDPSFSRLVRTLVDAFVLFTPLERPGRRIVKFSYIEAIGRPRAVRDRLVIALGSLGWFPVRYFFDIPALGESSSYHFEVAAPSGLHLVDPVIEPSGREGYTAVTIRRVGRTRSVAHFYIADAEPEDSARARVDLRPPRRGLVALSAGACFLVALFLSLISLEGSPTAQGTSSLLLAIPTILTFAASRAGEHPLLGHAVTGLRAVVIGCGLASFTAVLQISLELPSLCLHDAINPATGTLCIHPEIEWWAGFAWVCVLALVPAVIRAPAPPRDLQE